jgi:hypothetical protein
LHCQLNITARQNSHQTGSNPQQISHTPSTYVIVFSFSISVFTRQLSLLGEKVLEGCLLQGRGPQLLERGLGVSLLRNLLFYSFSADVQPLRSVDGGPA